ncbi:hypothetical protein [Pseudomonas sp. R5(2019)]|nr:hypothetical protein [Pseudomonas sp. R5(2019)]NBA93451.1 hypothetical protein [Pseudomonas sp. R5(2019)]
MKLTEQPKPRLLTLIDLWFEPYRDQPYHPPGARVFNGTRQHNAGGIRL